MCNVCIIRRQATRFVILISTINHIVASEQKPCRNVLHTVNLSCAMMLRNSTGNFRILEVSNFLPNPAKLAKVIYELNIDKSVQNWDFSIHNDKDYFRLEITLQVWMYTMAYWFMKRRLIAGLVGRVLRTGRVTVAFTLCVIINFSKYAQRANSEWKATPCHPDDTTRTCARAFVQIV